MSNLEKSEVEDGVRTALQSCGLAILGWFQEEDLPALLIGNIGSGFWPSFKKSREYSDGKPDPLDRWTQAVIDPLAEKFSGQVRYPFGEPNWPFQAYATRSTGIKSSPIGLLIHPEYGLWTAFRAVLVFENMKCELAELPPIVHPCDNCLEKPCLNTCPIGAFTQEGYDVRSCKSFVDSVSGEECRGGCLARNSCPVGNAWAYSPEHQRFHMSAYL